jgi:hypothetical protein
MIALVLLAQLTSAPTPAATPTPAPVVVAGTGQTRTLADVARERKLGVKGVKGGTMSVAGAPVSGAVSRASGAAGAAVPAVGADAEETAWRQRNADARGELAAAQAALAQADASLPAAAAIGWGARASAAMQYQVREGTLLPYRTRVADAQARVNALPEEARKAGAQPGWVRPTGDEVRYGRSLAETEKQLNNGDAPLPDRDKDIMPATSRVVR